ncbi:MAG TPA: DUF1028 domain-containing protein, partial [Candidatus Limnocylindrales bacterium]|nr:DUF1028 domain-containing protein [Candidatus Limnocylindrales bacterium]
MTYSIVAYDPFRGLMGVAACASGHGVGRAGTWAMGGVGVAATQADLTPRTGPQALELLRSGELRADEALAAIAEQHENPRGWQMGLLDREGRCAAHTGDLCLRHAGHVVGRGYSVQ